MTEQHQHQAESAMCPPLVDISCAGCGIACDRRPTSRGRWRVPAGWRRLQDRFWCPACKRQRFILRAIALPVSGPADGTWPELRLALHTAFGETTRCSNWLMTQFYVRDRQREPHDAQLPAMRRIYLYPEARTLFPALSSQTLASLEQQVLARYRAARLALVWRHAVSLPTYRYPVPLPLPARMWSLARHDERWHLSVRIGDRRWSLRLRHGPGMIRQLRLLEQVAAGTVEAGEATLYEIASHRGDHRSESATDRRLMVKVAVWVARHDGTPIGLGRKTTNTPAMTTAGVLIVRTASDAFLTAHLATVTPAPIDDSSGAVAGPGPYVTPRTESNDPWTLRGEHVRRWIVEAARRRQHLQEDLARTRRYGHVPDVVNVERRRAGRLRRRLNDWTHRATASLIAWANRRGVTTIVWDDVVGGYLPTYPWQQFLATLTYKAAVTGIRLLPARDVMATDEASTIGHLQAEARARPGTLAGRDRYRERAQAPEIAGRTPRRLRGDRNGRHDANPTAEGRSSGLEMDASTELTADDELSGHDGMKA
jgi:hypothetical protein